jgi:hypothetical protein
MVEIEIGSYTYKDVKRFLLITERQEWSLKMEEMKQLAIDLLKVLEKEGQDVPAIVKYAHEHLDEWRFR